MLTTLVTYWHEYEAAMKTLPYNADNVQALGMRFAKEWNDCKDELIAHTQWEPTKEDPEFDYAKHWSVMKELVRG